MNWNVDNCGCLDFYEISMPTLHSFDGASTKVKKCHVKIFKIFCLKNLYLEFQINDRIIKRSSKNFKNFRLKLFSSKFNFLFKLFYIFCWNIWYKIWNSWLLIFKQGNGNVSAPASWRKPSVGSKGRMVFFTTEFWIEDKLNKDYERIILWIIGLLGFK